MQVTSSQTVTKQIIQRNGGRSATEFLGNLPNLLLFTEGGSSELWTCALTVWIAAWSPKAFQWPQLALLGCFVGAENVNWKCLVHCILGLLLMANLAPSGLITPKSHRLEEARRFASALQLPLTGRSGRNLSRAVPVEARANQKRATGLSSFS